MKVKYFWTSVSSFSFVFVNIESIFGIQYLMGEADRKMYENDMFSMCLQT